MTRLLLRSLLALVVAAAAALVGWRVLKPTELVLTADHPIEAAWVKGPVVVGASNAAPLIVDNRYRVFASQRQIRSDGRADGAWVATSKWSLRRWPQQVSGVVSVGATVISRWSDGELIGQDATDGHVVWHAKGPAGPGYTGYRVGAQTVWAPVGLHTSGQHVVVIGGGTLATYDAATGTAASRAQVPAGCTDGFTTAGGYFVCATGAYPVSSPAPDSPTAPAPGSPTAPAPGSSADPAPGSSANPAPGSSAGAVPGTPAVAVAAWPPGPATPLGCDTAASGCRGLRDADGKGWTTDQPTPRRELSLDAAGATLVSGRVYTATGAIVDPATGVIIGEYPNMLVLGSTGRRIVLLDRTNHLIEVDRDTGATLDRRPMALHPKDSVDWKPGAWQLSGNIVAIERLHLDGPTDPAKPNYYYATDAVLTAALA